MPAQRNPATSARPTLRLSCSSADTPESGISASRGSPGPDFRLISPRFRANAHAGASSTSKQVINTGNLVLLCFMTASPVH